MLAFAELSGDTNPIHVDAESARGSGFSGRVAYAGVLLAEVSRIIGTVVLLRFLARRAEDMAIVMEGSATVRVPAGEASEEPLFAHR